MKRVIYVLMIVLLVIISVKPEDCYAQNSQLPEVKIDFHTGQSEIASNFMYNRPDVESVNFKDYVYQERLSWNYTSMNLFPELSVATLIMGGVDPKPIQNAGIVKTVEAEELAPEIVEPMAVISEKPFAMNKQISSKPLFALKTNLLYDAVSALNLEVEVPIGNKWSVAGEVIFPWWLWKKKQIALETFSGNLEGRYWFGDREKQDVLTGWFAGVYGGGGYYDLEWKKKGYQGEYYSVGFTGGFTHKIGKNLRMEYSLGLGYLGTKYRKYKACYSPEEDDWNLLKINSGNNKWVGPTRVKISLVWMLNKVIK